MLCVYRIICAVVVFVIVAIFYLSFFSFFLLAKGIYESMLLIFEYFPKKQFVLFHSVQVDHSLDIMYSYCFCAPFFILSFVLFWEAKEWQYSDARKFYYYCINISKSVDMIFFFLFFFLFSFLLLPFPNFFINFFIFNFSSCFILYRQRDTDNLNTQPNSVQYLFQRKFISHLSQYEVFVWWIHSLVHVVWFAIFITQYLLYLFDNRHRPECRNVFCPYGSCAKCWNLPHTKRREEFRIETHSKYQRVWMFECSIIIILGADFMARNRLFSNCLTQRIQHTAKRRWW